MSKEIIAFPIGSWVRIKSEEEVRKYFDLNHLPELRKTIVNHAGQEVRVLAKAPVKYYTREGDDIIESFIYKVGLEETSQLSTMYPHHTLSLIRNKQKYEET